MTLFETVERLPISRLRAEAAACTRCPLYKHATQTVFGEGPTNAPVMFIGEQPGDQEDLQGKPFVGPAGKIFDRALAEASIDRKRVYVTKQARGFLEKLRKETDKFNARIVNGIDRKQLEAASDALLAMKHNLLAMSGGTETDGEADVEEDAQPSKTRKKRRAAA